MRHALNADDWLVTENGLDLDNANIQETLFTVGNGYQASRGSLEEGHAGDLSGTYLAGVYDSHDSPVTDLVNAPSWLPVEIRIDGDRLDVDGCEVVSHQRSLDLRQGVLHRRTVFKDKAGRQTQLESLRFCSFADQHLGGVRVMVTPLDHMARISVRSGLDGDRRNLDRLPVYTKETIFPRKTKWDKWAKSVHLETTRTARVDDAIVLEARTLASGHRLVYAASLDVQGTILDRRVLSDRDHIEEVVDVAVQRGETIVIDKLATVYTSRDMAPAEASRAALDGLALHRSRGFDAALVDNAAAWLRKWHACDVVVEDNVSLTRAARFNIYHLLITANEHDPRANIGAKSLSGEGYRGHVFWDTEIFMLPFYIYTQPATARALMMYRYHTLQGAIDNARINGFKGAQYPWEAADTGHEVTPKWTADGLQRIWTGEEEIHVSADVAYGILTYVAATGDTAFLRDHGAEILFQTSRFWASRLEWSAERDRYELSRVIGPDEFHEHVDNNAFTNRMAQWHLAESADVFDRLRTQEPDALAALAGRLDLAESEVAGWREIASKVYIPYDASGRLIEQFEGYFALDDVPITTWDDKGMPVYPEGLDHFRCNGTQLVKQPDVVMLLHVLPDEFGDEVRRANYAFYEERTMHKSSLSPSVHAIFAMQIGDQAKALQYLERSAFVDLKNNQGNTQDGIHAASTGGTWQALVFGIGGFGMHNGCLAFNPRLPEGWTGLLFKIRWRGRDIAVSVRAKVIILRLKGTGEPEPVTIFGKAHLLHPGLVLEVEHD